MQLLLAVRHEVQAHIRVRDWLLLVDGVDRVLGHGLHVPLFALVVERSQ